MTDPFQASDRKLAAMRKQSTPVELLMEAIRCEKSRNSLRKTSGPPPRPLGQYIPRTTLSVEINCPQWRSSLWILLTTDFSFDDICHIIYLMKIYNSPVRGPPLPALCDECLLLTHHPIIAMTILTPLTPAINIFRWLNIF